MKSLLMTFQPTGQPTNLDPPTTYFSLRVTCPDWSVIESKVVYDVEDYLSYFHNPDDDDHNPHFHILFIGDVPVERLRKRVRDHIGGGNKYFSGKSLSNGVLAGISYCSRQNTPPIFKGEYWTDWIALAPKWEPKQRQLKIGEKRKAVHEDHFREITYRNMLKVCLRHREDRKLTTKSLAKVLESLHKENWFLNVQILRQGIPSTLYDEFEARCGSDTVMKEGRFARMRVVASWEGGFDR